MRTRPTISCLAAALLGVGCATAPRTAPRFIEPTTVPIQKATAAAKSHVESAQKTIVVIQDKCPEAKAEIDAVSTDLVGAINDLQTSEGARIQLQTQLEGQTAQANQLATDYDKASVQIGTLKESRHHWVKLFWISTAIAAAAAAWIFRKPLLAMIGGIGI